MMFADVVDSLNRIFWALVGIGICIILHMATTSNWLSAIHARLDRIPRKSDGSIEKS
jgi:hypothetical protein